MLYHDWIGPHAPATPMNVWKERVSTNTPPDDNHSQRPSSGSESRLDREVREILQKNRASDSRRDKDRKSDNVRQFRRPLSTPSSNVPARSVGSAGFEVWRDRLLENPLVLAVIIAVAAWLISDVSKLLATLLAFVAVAALFVPFANLGGKKTGPGEQKMWRGQVVEPHPNPTSPLDGLQRWWRSRSR